MRVDTIIENMVAILIKFTIFLFYPLFLKLELVLFYKRVVHYNTRIFIILLPHPVEISLFLIALKMLSSFNSEGFHTF